MPVVIPGVYEGRLARPAFAYDFLVSPDPIVGGGTTTTVIDANGTFVNSAGLIQQKTANVWPLDYDPATLQPLGRPIWEARTNLVTHSSDLSNAAWSLFGSTLVSANITTSPDGTSNADRITEVAGGPTFWFVSNTIPLADNTSYASTSFVKNAGRGFVAVGLNDKAGTLDAGYWDLATGVFSNQVGLGTGYPAQQFGDGWSRTQFVSDSSVGAPTGVLQVYVAEAAGSANYVGIPNTGVYSWGNQVEAGAFPTPYIPTAGAAVTRAADAASIAFNPGTQGTIVAEWIVGAPTAANQIVWSMNDGTAGNDIFLYLSSGAFDYRLAIFAGGVLQCDIPSGVTLTQGAIARAAVAFETNNVAISVNGSAVAVDTSVTIPAVNTLQFGFGPFGTASYLNGWERKLSYYPTRLPNTTLQLYSL